eukprot:1157603-Pelagomonas_calceolata.AAC.4
MLTGEDQSQADQLNSLAEGPPRKSKSKSLTEQSDFCFKEVDSWWGLSGTTVGHNCLLEKSRERSIIPTKLHSYWVLQPRRHNPWAPECHHGRGQKVDMSATEVSHTPVGELGRDLCPKGVTENLIDDLGSFTCAMQHPLPALTRFTRMQKSGG